MSAPAVMFGCDRCEFRASAMANWGIFNYQVENDTIPVERQLGWCRSCDTVTPAEVLPTRDSLNAAQARRDSLQAQIQDARNALQSEQSWIARLFGVSPRLPPDIQDLQFVQFALSQTVADWQRALDALKGRTSRPRCLLCGAHCESYLPSMSGLSEQDDDDDTSVPIGFMHPKCGGQLTAWLPGIRWSVRLRRRTYDLEGRLISETDREGA
jgi:hypothetical protein